MTWTWKISPVYFAVIKIPYEKKQTFTSFPAQKQAASPIAAPFHLFCYRFSILALQPLLLGSEQRS
jgi:hypothetical protein